MDYEALTKMQDEAIQFMLERSHSRGALLAFDMGLGKTRTGTRFAREYGVPVTLAVVPVATFDSWLAEVPVSYPEAGTPRLIDSSAQGKKNLSNFMFRVPGFYIVGHEYWERKAWVREPVKKRRKSDPDKFRKVWSEVWGGSGYTLIFDECHRAANVEAWTHKALRRIDPDVMKLGMSGTFMGGSFDGAYGATKWIWPDREDIIHKNIYDWRARWAKTIYDRFAPRNQKVVGELEPGAFVASLPCYIRVETSLPDPIEHKLWVELSPEQRRIYDELDDRMVAWIQEHPLVTDLGIVKRARQRQTTLAVPSLTFEEVLDEDGNEDIKINVDFDLDAESVKIDTLIRELKGQGTLGDLLVNQQLVIFTDSQKFARILTHQLNEHFGENTAGEWSGQITHRNRRILKEKFIAGDVRHIVGVQSAMGTGTDGLQHASHIGVFMSRSDRRIDNEQGIGRLNRTGQTKDVHMVHILARNTIDTGQLSKQVQDALDAARIMRGQMNRERRMQA